MRAMPKTAGNASKGNNDASKTITKIVMIKMDIEDATPEECRKAGIIEGKDKLVVENLNCSPNPSNGRFNLKFSSQDKNDLNITVKDITGKLIYTENVKAFSGTYDKEINIDNGAKGIYFVTIMQGSKTNTKKLVID